MQIKIFKIYFKISFDNKNLYIKGKNKYIVINIYVIDFNFII